MSPRTAIPPPLRADITLSESFRVPRCRILKRLVHVPRLPRRRQQPIAILRQQQPLGDEAIRCRGQSRSPDIARCVARFDRWPWIAGALPFGFSGSERDHRTLDRKQVPFAVAARTQRPAGMSCQRSVFYNMTEATESVAICIG